MLLAYTARPSAVVLATLFIILGLCVWVFAMLIRRETRNRRALLVREWAASHGLRVMDAGDPDAVVRHLDPLTQFSPHVSELIANDSVCFARLSTGEGDSLTLTAAPSWHVLIRKIARSWPTTAMRPTAHAVSIVDLFSLSSFPSLIPTQRFVIFGVRPESAGKLAASTAPALLPADVGLLLSTEYLILDFTHRLFDEIEFERMQNLAEQLAPRLSAE
jgi:hypothetical protein